MAWWKIKYSKADLEEKVRVAETILSMAESRLDNLDCTIHSKTILQAQKAIKNAEEKLAEWERKLDNFEEDDD